MENNMSIENFDIAVVILVYGENYEVADDLVAGYITAMLRKNGYSVDIIEIDKDNENIGLEYLTSKEYKMVIFTIPTSSNIPELINFSNYVKSKNPLCNTVLTGWDHHSAPIDIDAVIRSSEAIDVIIRGEGEQTVVELAELLYKNKSLDNCEGITFRIGERIVSNNNRSPIACLDELPFPARDTHTRHSYESFRISSARGCLGNCTFCPVPAERVIGNSPWRGRTPENVVSELKELVNTFGIRHFMFIDPTFEDPGEKGKERIREISRLIIKENLNINFLVNMRAENWSDSDRELLELLYKAGLESVTVGIEAGNERTLRLFNKRAHIQDFFTFINLMKDFNIYLAYGFIMFHSYCEIQDLRDNSNFLKEAGIGHMMGAYLIKLKAFPRTQIFQKLQSDNLVKTTQNGVYSLFDYKYIDPRVQRLAEKMSWVEQQLNVRPDIHFYNIQKFTTFVSRIRRKIEKSDNQESMKHLLPIENAVEQMKNSLNELNHKWFSQCIDWAEQDGKDEEFDNIMNKHFADLKVEYDKVKSVQMRSGRGLIRVMNM